MRNSVATLVASLALSLPAFAESEPGHAFDWDQWRHLPVQEGGRNKPLDTLAWETLRTLCNRASFTDPDTGKNLNATELYLVLLFDWQGWDQPSGAHMSAGMASRDTYFIAHKADKWDRARLLRVDFLELRKALGMAEDQKYLSPLELSQAHIRDPHSDAPRPFVLWARKLLRREQDGFTTFEKKAVELAGKLWSYQDHRMGRRLEVVPIQDSQERQWASIAHLLQSNFDDLTDPTGEIRKAKQQFQKARAAYRNNSPRAFNQAGAAFIAAVKQLGPQLGAYPEQATIDLEVAYNHWAPFRFAWVLTTLAFLFLLLFMGANWKPFYVLGLTSYVAGLVAMLVGFWLRITISGRAPVTNMYESVIYLGLGTAVFGLIFEFFCRKQYILTAAGVVSTIALILADNCPAVLDPSLRPLQPVLRSNFWLITHVMSITLSYAAFALALGIANITLGYYLAGSRNRETINALSKFTYKALQVGVLLLAAGTILGGVWADYSWGRFWGWDPKEVWALIALLGYLAVLHARYTGWVGHFGLAALSVICFSLVVMAWYGVNFVLGAGLHTYGFGGGGQNYVYGTLAIQFLYVGAAALRFSAGKPATPLGQASLAEQANPPHIHSKTRGTEKVTS